MPIKTFTANNTPAQWIPPEITAYVAIKINSINFVVTNVAGAAANFVVAMGFDKELLAAVAEGEVSDELQFRLAYAANGTVAFEIPNVDKIIGDFIYIITDSVNARCTAIINYSYLKTNFDQYGQVSKTFKRALARRG